MKSLIFLASALTIMGCSYKHAKSLDDRMENCKEGYQMALRSGIRGITEDVIFQIVLKRMNGYFENTDQLEFELSQLILTSEDTSTRKKANLALRFLTDISNFNIANIRAVYHDENKLYDLLEQHSGFVVPEHTRMK